MVSKLVILAGGLGTRLSEETEIKPKPMIEIGGYPMLWHIMKLYSHYGISEFIVCLGYKGYVAKEYFSNYYLHQADATFDLKKNTVEIHRGRAEPWRVSLVDTGAETMTGGRLARIREYIGNEAFCMTYGDGLSNIDIRALIAGHLKAEVHATVSAVRPPGRFGALRLENEKVTGFYEKPAGDGGFINGGFFVLSSTVFDYVNGDSTVWEQEPLERLAAEGQLRAHVHEGFWQPMDTLRDRRHLEELWASGNAPWKVW